MVQFNFHYSRWQKIPSWLSKPTNFWIFVAGVFAASLLVNWSGYAWDFSTARQDRIRYSGWVLDTLGLLLIAIGISGKLDRFEGKNLWEYAIRNVASWFREFPLFSQDVIVSPGTANMTLGSPTVRAYGTNKIDPSRPTDEKVNWLLEQHDSLVKTMLTLMQNAEKNTKEQEQRISQLATAVNENIESVREESADVHIGDVGKEFVGLVWIFCGITFATVPEFIEAWFGWLISWFEDLGRIVGFV